MKTTPRAGDYVRTAGMTIPQYHAVAKVFIDAGAHPGEYPSDYEFNVREAFGIHSKRKSLFHGMPKSSDEEYALNGRELSLSDLLGDELPGEPIGALNGMGASAIQPPPNWHELGVLPPVGIECEVELNGSWVSCKIIAHDERSASMVAVFKKIGNINGEYLGRIAGLFRPLKSEREIAIEEMVKHIKINGYEFVGGSDAKIAGNLYDAGYRRVEK